MTIKELLQSDKVFNVRVSYRSRWIVGLGGEWVVYERLPYAKRTKEIIVTKDEELAVAKLLEGVA